MPSRIQEWVAEQWFNKQPGGTPITAERLSRIEEQVEGVTLDLNAADETMATKAELASAIGDIDLDFIPATADVQNIVKITQAAYDALTTKVATTLYVIVG